MKTNINKKRVPPMSLRLDPETIFLLAQLALRFHTSDAGAVRNAIKWCHAQQCPTPIVPQIAPKKDVGNVLVLLESYYALLATVARKFYPIHFPDEPPERTKLVDDFQLKSQEALAALGENLDKLRVLSLAVSSAQSLNLEVLREYSQMVWRNYTNDAKRLEANDPKITNRGNTEKLQSQRLELLRLLNLSGIWFDNTFQIKSL